MKTVVLDDDPTGTQSAAHVRVLLETSSELLEQSFRASDSVYVLTNSRAIDEASAVALVTRVRDEAREAAARLGEQVRFVLRGDSTLRGHVFAETEVFMDDNSVMLFVPAFPDGGRTTRGGVHYVRLAGEDVRADDTEFADDPVFPFTTAVLADYVTSKSRRLAVPVGLETVRSGELAAVIRQAAPGSVVIPDIETNSDIRRVAVAVEEATAAGASVTVRSASPLAAALAGVESSGLLVTPLGEDTGRVLLVCGSHTAGATAQLAAVRTSWGEPIVIETDAALADPLLAGSDAATLALRQLESRGLAVVSTERVRSAEHNTLDHGEKVMHALTSAVRELLPASDVIVSKGGITSAETARVGLGASSALVLGQVLPGVSVWSLTASDGRDRLYVVVPGNVGESETLVRVLDALGKRTDVILPVTSGSRH